MSRYPKVSVIITCYNYGQYIEGCLRSVLDQTYSDYEIIVVDDGSTDDTPQIIQKLSNFFNFHYIYQENAGQANAKNRGISEARGGFIAFLDADDLWKVDKLEKQIKLFEDPDVGVVYTRAKLIDESGGEYGVGFGGKFTEPKSGRVSKWLFLDNFVWFSSSVVRSACFQTFGPFDESLQMGIDWNMWLRISTKYKFDFVDEALIRYRVGHAGQMSKNVEVRHECSDRIMTMFLDTYPGVIDQNISRLAYFLTFCNRGNYFRHIDKCTSYRFYFKAIILSPFRINAYKGIVKNLISFNS